MVACLGMGARASPTPTRASTLVSSASLSSHATRMNLRFLFVCSVLAALLCACGHSPEPADSPGVAAPAAPISTTPAPVIAPANNPPPGAPVSAAPISGVYIWQRVWMPAHIDALNDSKTLFSELRVLAAQQQPREGWIDAHVDLDALKSDGRAVWPVIRLDGRLATLDADAIATRAHDVVAAWRAAGVRVDGVEIDFDCASSRLADYAKLLAAIKTKLAKDATLSITALPAWIGAAGLAAVLAQSDEAVLQVHAVSDPKHGLFDAKQAKQWIDAFAKQTTKPFRVALPAYGSALVLDAQGHQVGVESEAPLAEPGARLELFSDPRTVADLLHTLKQSPPPNLRGYLWFRLPLPGDRRAWPLATIDAVIGGKELHSAWTPEIGDGGNGAFDISVRNSGNLEAVLPASVEISTFACQKNDANALPGYRVEVGDDVLRFVRETDKTLPATQTRPLGWVRCMHLVPGDVHVHP